MEKGGRKVAERQGVGHRRGGKKKATSKKRHPALKTPPQGGEFKAQK